MRRWPCLVLLFLAGCASVKVRRDTVQQNGEWRKPDHVYVALFDTTHGAWNVDRTGDELAKFKENAATELRQMMLDRFPEIAPTSIVPSPLPNSGLLVTGEFTRVNQGSRAMRSTIGFGAGGTKVETKVRLYDLSISATQPVATFDTTGGSNAEPGFLAGGMVQGAASAATTGLQPDWERTSREIRNFILDHFR